MRVVFDTNIFVSALVFPGGRADAALQRILYQGISLMSLDSYLRANRL